MSGHTNFPVATHPDVVTVIHGDPTTLTTKLVSAQSFARGAVIAALTNTREATKQSYLTVQVAPMKHIELQNDFQFANHSCAPTARFDLEAMQVVAMKDLAPGDEITVFYPAFEWDMSSPFECWCGFPNCLKRVQGAKYIPNDHLQAHFLSRHIREMKQDALQQEAADGIAG